MSKQNLSLLQLSTVAKEYYQGCIGKQHLGMEKYVATDGENTMFVKSDYEPSDGEAVYYIKATFKGLHCQLYKPYSNQ